MSQNQDQNIVPPEPDANPHVQQNLSPDLVSERATYPFIPRPPAFANPTLDLFSAQG